MTAPSPTVAAAWSRGDLATYYHAWTEGCEAMRAGHQLRDNPYHDVDRPFTATAWRDGWRRTARLRGVILPADLPPVDETTPPPREDTP